MPGMPCCQSAGWARRREAVRSRMTLAWWVTCGVPGLISMARTHWVVMMGTGRMTFSKRSVPEAGTARAVDISRMRSGGPSCHSEG